LSEADKVACEPLVPAWIKFADLSVEQKFEQARLMGFEERDAYLRERCRAAKMEVDYAASALDRATAIIESNLPFFIVHFEDLDAQGERSDLKGRVLGKTEWLRQNMPDISKGTFYAALNVVKARIAEQKRMMLGDTDLPHPKGRLTEIQNAVVSALVGQGYKHKDAVEMVKAAEGQDFESLFRSALPQPPVEGKSSEVTVEADQGEQGDEARPGEEELNESVASEFDADDTERPVVQTTPITAADELKTALADEPDRDVASRMLTDYLRTVAKQFGNEHIQIKDVSATVEFAGRGHRIMPGDWLEKSALLEKRSVLCKCVGIAEFMQRRRVQDWNEGKWGKEHVVFGNDEFHYRVITEEAARKIAPEVFPAPTSPEGL
jgi:hypothetical protein